MKHRTNSTALVLAAVSVGFLASAAQAQLNPIFGVGNDIWKFDPVTAQATRIFDITSANVPGWDLDPKNRMNGLAYDHTRNMLIFGNDKTLNVYGFSLNAMTFDYLGNLAAVAPLSTYPHLSSYSINGGATSFDGRYYLTLDLKSESAYPAIPPGKPISFMVEVGLNPLGTGIVSAGIYGGTSGAPTSGWGAAYPNGFSDLGDFTVNISTGELWGYSYPDNLGGGLALQGYWHGNITTPGVGVGVLSTVFPEWSQIAYDSWNDKMYAVSKDYLYEIDKNTGATLSVKSIIGYTDTSGVIADIAVPEPAEYGVAAALGCGLFLLWRRRQKH
ncbi:MAG: hypothetical protein FJ387_01485 [Verrucomicrobia bacterium]|nr:hypothetical protein [Verrucomicrobiota bacterium]